MASTPTNGVVHDYLLVLFKYLFSESPVVYDVLFSVEAALVDQQKATVQLVFEDRQLVLNFKQ